MVSVDALTKELIKVFAKGLTQLGENITTVLEEHAKRESSKEAHNNVNDIKNSLPLKLTTLEIETLPDILTAQHISDYLNISRRRVYELFQIKPIAGGIPNLEIGMSKRVDKQDFINWIIERKHDKDQKTAG